MDKSGVKIASNLPFWYKDWLIFRSSNLLFLDKKWPELSEPEVLVGHSNTLYGHFIYSFGIYLRQIKLCLVILSMAMSCKLVTD